MSDINAFGKNAEGIPLTNFEQQIVNGEIEQIVRLPDSSKKLLGIKDSRLGIFGVVTSVKPYFGRNTRPSGYKTLWSGKKMDDEFRGMIQEFINVFRNKISTYIDPIIGQNIQVAAFPAGVTIGIRQLPKIANSDNFRGDFTSAMGAFNAVGQKVEEFYEGDQLKTYKNEIEKVDHKFSDVEIFLGMDGIFLVMGKRARFLFPIQSRKYCR